MRLLDSALLTIPDLSTDAHDDALGLPTLTPPAPFKILASEDYDGDFDFDLDLDDDDDDVDDDEEEDDDDVDDDDDDDDDDTFESADDEEE